MPELDHPARVTPRAEGDPTGRPRPCPSSVSHLRRPFVVLVALIGLVFVACEPENFGREIAVENRTTSALTVEAVDENGERIRGLGTVEPGQAVGILGWASFSEYSLVGRDECTIVDLVALDADGREVARHPPPLCLDDVWVIESA